MKTPTTIDAESWRAEVQITDFTSKLSVLHPGIEGELNHKKVNNWDVFDSL